MWPKLESKPLRDFFFGIMILSLLGGVNSLGASEMGIKAPNTIVDQAGREIKVKKPFNRIISLYGAHTENLFALGLQENMVGVSVNDNYPPQVEDKKAFSYKEGPEKFLAVQPDCLLVRPMIDRGYARLIKRLEDYGIVVVSLQPKNIQDMYTYWKILGVLTGRKKQAKEMIKAFDKGLSFIQELQEGLDRKKRVYFEAIHDKMKTFSPESIAMFVLGSAGGVNVAKDAKTIRDTNIAAYGQERILAKAKEIDIYLAQKGPMNQPTRAMITNEPGFHLIKAIKKDQIFFIDEQIVSRPTLRLLNGMFTIGRYLYPERFTESAWQSLKQRIPKTLRPALGNGFVENP